MFRRLIDLWWRSKSRCGVVGPWPWRLVDCGTCIRPRGHEGGDGNDPEWHADGTGYIWSADRWGWRGPVISLADERLTEDPPIFHEIIP